MLSQHFWLKKKYVLSAIVKRSLKMRMEHKLLAAQKGLSCITKICIWTCLLLLVSSSVELDCLCQLEKGWGYTKSSPPSHWHSTIFGGWHGDEAFPVTSSGSASSWAADQAGGEIGSPAVVTGSPSPLPCSTQLLLTPLPVEMRVWTTEDAVGIIAGETAVVRMVKPCIGEVRDIRFASVVQGIQGRAASLTLVSLWCCSRTESGSA